MTEPTRIFHNPRCSKSRQALALLQEQGIDPEIVRYLDTPPDSTVLNDILMRLDCPARKLMRTKETLYRELSLDDPALSDTDLVTAMVEHPKLIERPIVLHNGRAVIGRPPELVLSLF